MNQCPVCSSEIQDSFGLIECPSCHKILFADFDGTLKIHEEASSEEFATVPVESAESNFADDWNAQETDSPTAEDLPEAFEASEEIEVVEKSVVRETPSAIDEINSFANSEESSLKQGVLIYNLTIKNIDTEDLKKEILEILKDSKFNIDVQKLKFSLPTLELKGLNPVKVSVIVSKIKHLPVEIEWDQRSAVLSEVSNAE